MMVCVYIVKAAFDLALNCNEQRTRNKIQLQIYLSQLISLSFRTLQLLTLGGLNHKLTEKLLSV
jgi:hypothetical protein